MTGPTTMAGHGQEDDYTREWAAVNTSILCRSKSHRCTSGCVSIFIDEATEDAGAQGSIP
jgi:hypothetical protein